MIPSRRDPSDLYVSTFSTQLKLVGLWVGDIVGARVDVCVLSFDKLLLFVDLELLLLLELLVPFADFELVSLLYEAVSVVAHLHRGCSQLKRK